MTQTAFTAIAEVIQPGMTPKDIQQKANVSKSAVLAYLKRRSAKPTA